MLQAKTYGLLNSVPQPTDDKQLDNRRAQSEYVFYQFHYVIRNDGQKTNHTYNH